jgi:DNA repair protein RadD
MDLRPYQHSVISALTASEARRKLLVAPTGSGKTVIAAEVVRTATADGKRVLFLAHRRELIHQAKDKLAEFGIESGVILAGEQPDPEAPVQVASIQTLWRRRFNLPPADLVVVDEGHHCRARTYRSLIDRYPEATIIGLTATPCRADGRGLGNVFEAMVECPSVQALIDRNYLVPTKVFAPSTPDLVGVHVRRGDYVEAELAAAVDKPKLVGDIVTHWHRLAERRKTVVFATSVAHAIHLKAEFIKSGVKAEHIDGATPKDERDEILKRLSRGEIEVVCNCMVLTEGWDQPDVSCIVLARPTKSMGLHRQMVGRVLRPSPGKEYALVLDHAGAVFQHGFVEEVIAWTLDSDQRALAPVHAARAAGPASSSLVACKKCSAIRTAGKPCPNCGHMPRPAGRYLAVHDGDLAHIDRKGRIQPNEYTPEQRHEFHRMLVGIALSRGYKPGWAAHKFKERFGTWPQSNNVEPLEPNAEVMAWDRHCRIRYAKAMEAAANG